MEGPADTYLEQFAAADAAVSEFHDAVTYDGQIDPQYVAAKWQQAEEAVDTFVSWTYDDGVMGQEEQLAENLQERYAGALADLELTEKQLHQQGLSIEQARRQIDPHYNLMQTVETAENAIDALEETVDDYQEILDAYWDGRLDWQEAADTIDYGTLQEQSATVDELRNRAVQLLQHRQPQAVDPETYGEEQDAVNELIQENDQVWEKNQLVDQQYQQFVAEVQPPQQPQVGEPPASQQPQQRRTYTP